MANSSAASTWKVCNFGARRVVGRLQFSALIKDGQSREGGEDEGESTSPSFACSSIGLGGVARTDGRAAKGRRPLDQTDTKKCCQRSSPPRSAPTARAHGHDSHFQPSQSARLACHARPLSCSVFLQGDMRHGRANANSKTPSIPPSSKRPGKSLKSAVALIRKEGGRPPPKLPRDRERVHILLTSYPPPRPTRSPSGREHAVPGTR